MKPSQFDDLLETGEEILWSAQAQRQKDAALATCTIFLFGIAFIVMAIWMFIEGSNHPPPRNSIGILAPFFALSAGLVSVWAALKGKILLPPPTYAVSSRQAFIAEYKSAGGIRRSWFVLDRTQPATVIGTGNRCHCRIPLMRKSHFVRASITFAYLTEFDTEALLRALAKVGEPSGLGR